MDKYEVKITNGVSFATSIYVMATSAGDAVKHAKAQSRLSDFPLWKFIPIPV